MTAAAGGAAAGATAAAAAHQAMLRRQEEEEMTPYTEQDLAQEWEFKILRSTMGAFKKPAELKQACQEEARAGWVLVEKFDNGRLRFKRRRSAGANDDGLGQDPYRTTYGAGEAKVVVVVLLGILAAVGIAIALVVLFSSSGRGRGRRSSVPSPAAGPHLPANLQTPSVR